MFGAITGVWWLFLITGLPHPQPPQGPDEV